MADDKKSVREELEAALLVHLASFVTEQVDPGLIRRFIEELAIEGTQRVIQGWEVKNAIEKIANRLVTEQIDAIATEIVNGEECQTLLRTSVKKRIEEAIKRGAEVQGARTLAALQGDGRR